VNEDIVSNLDFAETFLEIQREMHAELTRLREEYHLPDDTRKSN
jgi:hypothetical protein